MREWEGKVKKNKKLGQEEEHEEENEDQTK